MQRDGASVRLLKGRVRPRARGKHRAILSGLVAHALDLTWCQDGSHYCKQGAAYDRHPQRVPVEVWEGS